MPSELEQTPASIAPETTPFDACAITRDGTELHLRAIGPDDEPLLQDLFTHMSQDDRRMRFFIAIGVLSHEFAARLCRAAYPQELALVALQGREPLGITRYAAESGERRAEYAIAVRSDWKGRGVGYVLLTHLIAAARGAGLTELFGDVLAENQRMIAMCRDFGFHVEHHPGDAGLLRLRKPI
ncbi:MAG: GNAT family N-acetyltransferase [Alphaproteobacteria bacterium]|nr:GNAT family N-acetyltransferase [Alphaproteobacteria bacterium]